MSELLVHPGAPEPDGTRLRVTPESAGWGHVGFELLALAPGVVSERATGDREVCIVAVSGVAHVRSRAQHSRDASPPHWSASCSLAVTPSLTA